MKSPVVLLPFRTAGVWKRLYVSVPVPPFALTLTIPLLLPLQVISVFVWVVMVTTVAGSVIVTGTVVLHGCK